MHWKVKKKATRYMYENSKQVNKQWLAKDGVIQQKVCGLVVGCCPFWEIFHSYWKCHHAGKGLKIQHSRSFSNKGCLRWHETSTFKVIFQDIWCWELGRGPVFNNLGLLQPGFKPQPSHNRRLLNPLHHLWEIILDFCSNAYTCKNSMMGN